MVDPAKIRGKAKEKKRVGAGALAGSAAGETPAATPEQKLEGFLDRAGTRRFAEEAPPAPAAREHRMEAAHG